MFANRCNNILCEISTVKMVAISSDYLYKNIDDSICKYLLRKFLGRQFHDIKIIKISYIL